MAETLQATAARCEVEAPEAAEQASVLETRAASSQDRFAAVVAVGCVSHIAAGEGALAFVRVFQCRQVALVDLALAATESG